MSEVDSTIQDLRHRFGADVGESAFRDNRRVVVPAKVVHRVLEFLCRDKGFDLLVDVTAVDYLEYPDAVNRFGVVYLLTNTATNTRLIVKTHLNPPDLDLPTATDLWRGADWMEREVYDMFGIKFDGHPDLKRILLPEEWKGYPLRKDYGILQQDNEWVQINLGIESGQ
jgi:NADH-quinone oxidoreductase subunit C